MSGRLAGAAAMVMAASVSAMGQSLFQAPGGSGPVGQEDPVASLRGVSILLVEPPPPREYQVHDLVTIIIDENSRATSSQKLETEEDGSTSAEIRSGLDPLELLELRLREADTGNISIIDARGETEFTGEGDYERSDRFVARLTATVIDVKPNGTLVLEARKRIEHNGEVQEYVLSGVVRSEDITAQNTVQSGQVADLAVVVHNEGELREAARKGWLTRALESIFGS